MDILEQHKREIQGIIEGMTSGSEMLIGEIYKRYKTYYPVYAVYEEVQRVLKLNLRRYRLFKNENLLTSIIARVEDYV